MLKLAIIFLLACICSSASEQCNEDVSGNFGSIVSPGYPDELYANNLDCNYKITTPVDTIVTIEITDMSLEYGNDYLNIYDGPTNESTLLGTYTGTQERVYIYASTNVALVYFHTNDNVQDKGFYIYFEEAEPEPICPLDNFTDDSGFIKSPLYPEEYPNNTGCYYHIKTPAETQITLHVNSFDVELSTDCAKDFLQIFDGPTSNNKSLSKLCGPGPFHDIISSQNELLAHFHSDSSEEGLGFNITYFTSACTAPIIYNGDFGTIYSPGYPVTNYPDFSNCNYTVVTPPGSQVLLYVNYLNLEETEMCSYDSLRVYDGPDNTDRELALFCGYTSNQFLGPSTSNEVLLEFRSDHSVTYEGFIITYIASYNYGSSEVKLNLK